ncbi:MAG: hypothetical protein HPY66_1052 [Firmicutes bacterium]|nr:hypothetical protein [Bacillota bacterium]
MTIIIKDYRKKREKSNENMYQVFFDLYMPVLAFDDRVPEGGSRSGI